jgi:hypothetical protein
MHPTSSILIIAVTCATSIAAGAAEPTAEMTDLSARLFIDFTKIDFDNDGIDQPPSGVGIDVKRGYLVLAHTFDSMWAANITTDFNYSASTGETQLFIKKAYLQAKFSDALVARAGAADMPWIPYMEEFYGYRYLEKTLIDRTNFGNSSDWGAHVGGKAASGALNYGVAVINGGGHKNPTRSNSMDVEGRIGYSPLPGLTMALGFYSGKLGQDIEGLPAANQPRTAQRVNAFAGYSHTLFRIGVEYFAATDWKVSQSAATDKAAGYSAWAAYTISPQFSVFARFDKADPRKETNAALSETYANLGIAYKPRKNIEFAFAYKRDQVENGSFKTGDVTIGTPTGTQGTYQEIGVWTLVSF